MHQTPDKGDDEAARLRALRQREERAFTALFERYADPLYRLAAGLLSDETEAEDVVQEAFSRVLTHLDRFRGEARVDVWLYRVTHNACVSRLRRRRPRLSLDDMDALGEAPAPRAIVAWQATPDEILEDVELRGHLDGALATLPEGLRAAFLLRDIEGLSTADAAAVLNVSEAALKVRLHRARLALREYLTRIYGMAREEGR